MIEKLIAKLAREAISAQVFPGCVIGVVRRSGEQFTNAYGNYTYEVGAKAMHRNTIFDIASITKSITASLALRLSEVGILDIEDLLIKYVPEFHNSHKNELKIKHLLTQTIDCSFRLSDHKNKRPEEIIHLILTSEFNSPPGTKFFHTNASSILLGMAVERASEKNLSLLSKEQFFDPLEMFDTSFDVNEISKAEIAPTEFDSWRNRIICGEVHDETAYVLNAEQYVGSAGIFSTVPNLLSFLGMLLNEGCYQGARYFKPETLQLMYTNQLEKISEKGGMGWDIAQPRFMGKLCTPQTFGKVGYTGCSWICNVSLDIGLVILSNTQFPTRKKDSLAINQFRGKIADLVFRHYSLH